MRPGLRSSVLCWLQCGNNCHDLLSSEGPTADMELMVSRTVTCIGLSPGPSSHICWTEKSMQRSPRYILWLCTFIYYLILTYLAE